MSFIIRENKTPVNENQTAELKTLSSEAPNGEHIFAKIDSSGNINKLFVEGKKVKGKKMASYQAIIDSILLADKLSNAKANRMVTSQKTQEANINNIDTSEIQKDIQEAMKEVSKELGLNLNIRDSTGHVSMKGNNKGFKMNINNDELNNVKMDFGEKGVYMKVVEDGKTKFYMNINENGIEMNVDDEE